MLVKPPTDKQLAATFDRLVTDLSAGRLSAVPTCTGLDDATVAALNQIAGADDKRAAVDHAREVFTRGG